MDTQSNTLFLRLEGPLQAWGDNSKFVIRRTMDAPTKSGVLGLLCCAMGTSREEAGCRLPDLNDLVMGVRIDREGTRWWDYHTVGAGVGVLNAQGVVKRTASTGEIETLVSRREYLCDASFLVALLGAPGLVRELCDALHAPIWPVFLGRKSCPPSAPVFQGMTGSYPDPLKALAGQPWCPRLPRDHGARERMVTLQCLLEWRPSPDEPTAPEAAEVWYDRPVYFEPPVHEARLVTRTSVSVPVGQSTQRPGRIPGRPQANYRNSHYREVRDERLRADHGLCVFCKAPATTVQHTTYRNAGGREQLEDLRSLCRLCHDAVTMVEYGLGMGLDRINPEDAQWRERITAKREEIIAFRSLETRRRRLSAEEVE